MSTVKSNHPPCIIKKDGVSRMVLHRTHFEFLGRKEKTPCDCPTHLARGTVDSLIGKFDPFSPPRIELETGMQPSVLVIPPQVRTLRIIYQTSLLNSCKLK